jgi:hypothetical protein
MHAHKGRSRQVRGFQALLGKVDADGFDTVVAEMRREMGHSKGLPAQVVRADEDDAQKGYFDGA